MKKELPFSSLIPPPSSLSFWSGRRDLNPRLRPWQGRTLPLSYSRSRKENSTDKAALVKRRRAAPKRGLTSRGPVAYFSPRAPRGGSRLPPSEQSSPQPKGFSHEIRQ